MLVPEEENTNCERVKSTDLSISTLVAIFPFYLSVLFWDLLMQVYEVCFCRALFSLMRKTLDGTAARFKMRSYRICAYVDMIQEDRSGSEKERQLVEGAPSSTSSSWPHTENSIQFDSEILY